MFKTLMQRVVGSRHEREAKKLQPTVGEINRIVAALESLSDDELRAKTEEFRARIAERTRPLHDQVEALREEKRGSEDASDRERMSVEIGGLEKEVLDALEAALDELLPEAYAVVKEACRRLVGTEVVVTGHALRWDMVPYDVQLVGAIALHDGKVAEMATVEGKTLVATMPLYLNALAGRGAHLVTVNSYLAQRDAEWMGAIYSVSSASAWTSSTSTRPGSPTRREAYRADITYGTNNEFGFDYLRDNMVHTLEQRVQRGHHYAIIDEVDSILIDEARTPLIISGPVGRDTSTPFKQYKPARAEPVQQAAARDQPARGGGGRRLRGGRRRRGGTQSPGGATRDAQAQEAAEDVRRRSGRAEAGAARGGRPYAREAPPRDRRDALLRDGREGPQRPSVRQGAG